MEEDGKKKVRENMNNPTRKTNTEVKMSKNECVK